LSRLHIFLWLWKGWRAVYDRRDINAVATMLREKGQLPDSTRIVLLTDQPTDWHSTRTKALDVEELPLWADPTPRVTPGRPNCFRRLKLFGITTQKSLGVELDDIVMSMDADSIVSGPIMPLLADFTARTHNFAAMGGVASRIHGSLFAFRAFSHSHLWANFHPQLTPILLTQPWGNKPRPIGSDQAWMTRNVTGERLWQREDGCYSWARHGALYSPRYTENACYWSFAGTTKPGSELVNQVRPDLYAAWQDAYHRELP
jgi:hypothetical protein